MHCYTLPVTPTTKSILPSSRSFLTAFKPDMTGIWLSMKTMLKTLAGFDDPCCNGPSDALLDPLNEVEPVNISTASCPFSAVETSQPILVSMRFISVMVNGSSSTTRTSGRSAGDVTGVEIAGPEDSLVGVVGQLDLVSFTGFIVSEEASFSMTVGLLDSAEEFSER